MPYLPDEPTPGRHEMLNPPLVAMDAEYWRAGFQGNGHDKWTWSGSTSSYFDVGEGRIEDNVLYCYPN
jgi:hypothetical protein